MELIQSKSLLAKLMATENLHIEQRQVATASFDVENRILTIPILEKELSSHTYDLFVGHEVGHALYTPLEGLKKAFEMKLSMSVMNVLEDSRIERKIKLKYPGIRQSFIKAYKELMERDFFGTINKDVNKLNFIDRVNLYCKGGVETGITFTDEEKSILNEIESTSTYEDVIEVYKKVKDYMNSLNEEAPVRPKDGHFEYTDDDSFDEDSEEVSFEQEDGQEQEGQRTKSVEEDDGEDSESEGKGENSGTDMKEEGSEEDGSQVGTGREGSDSTKSLKEPISYTDENFRRNEHKLFSNDGRKYYYGNVPKLNLDSIIVDHKVLWPRHRKDIQQRRMEYNMPEFTGTDVAGFKKLREDSKKVVSYLVKEFELKKNAEQMKRASVSKTGELNMSKIYSYKFSEDIFKKMTVVPNGKSHGLVMFIDWSGSMSNNIGNTIKQLLNLVMFCKKVNIPYEVYAFTSSYDDYEQRILPKKDDMHMGHFHLMNLLSSRMSASEYSYAASVLIGYDSRFVYKPDWFGLSGTPLNQAIVAAMEIIPKFQKDNRLQIVNTVFLTDGDGEKSMSIYDATGRSVYIDNRKGSSVVIRDPISKHEEVVDYNCWARELTSAYIKLLKARTNCNIVGFYILGSREFGSQMSHFLVMDNKEDRSWKRDNEISLQVDKMKITFRKNKYQIVTNGGFDEYYLLRAEGMDTDEDSEFEVKENATTKGFVNAFTKYHNNRKTNRVVLGRFIEMIA